MKNKAKNTHSKKDHHDDHPLSEKVMHAAETAHTSVDGAEVTYELLEKLAECSRLGLSNLHAITHGLANVAHYFPPIKLFVSAIGLLSDAVLPKEFDNQHKSSILRGTQAILGLGILALGGLSISVLVGAIATPVAPFFLVMGLAAATFAAIMKITFIKTDKNYKAMEGVMKDIKEHNPEAYQKITQAIKMDKSVAEIMKLIQNEKPINEVSKNQIESYLKQRKEMKESFYHSVTHGLLLIGAIITAIVLVTNPVVAFVAASLSFVGVLGTYLHKMYDKYKTIKTERQELEQMSKVELSYPNMPNHMMSQKFGLDESVNKQPGNFLQNAQNHLDKIRQPDNRGNNQDKNLTANQEVDPQPHAPQP